MKTALVCGAGGFIGGHLVKKLKREGHWVRGVDIKEHEFAPSAADEFLLLDLRDEKNCITALARNGEIFDEVYQLAADMGGMGFIHTAECDIMHNSALINIHMTQQASKLGVPRYFFSSSVCVYRDILVNPRCQRQKPILPNQIMNMDGKNSMLNALHSRTHATKE